MHISSQPHTKSSELNEILSAYFSLDFSFRYKGLSFTSEEGPKYQGVEDFCDDQNIGNQKITRDSVCVCGGACVFVFFVQKNCTILAAFERADVVVVVRLELCWMFSCFESLTLK